MQTDTFPREKIMLKSTLRQQTVTIIIFQTWCWKMHRNKEMNESVKSTFQEHFCCFYMLSEFIHRPFHRSKVTSLQQNAPTEKGHHLKRCFFGGLY